MPAYRTISYRETFDLQHPGTAVNASPLYRLPFGTVFLYTLAAPAIGVALGAIQTFREQASVRLSVRGDGRVAEDPFIQLCLAEAAATVLQPMIDCSTILPNSCTCCAPGTRSR